MFRNTGAERVPVSQTGTPLYGTLEWELLSNAICTHLTRKYDTLFRQRFEAVFEDD